MIRGHFLSEEDRNKLIALARDGSVASRVTRRDTPLVVWWDGWGCGDAPAALLVDGDTLHGWHKLFEKRWIRGLDSFDIGRSASFLFNAQEDTLQAYVGPS